ncbi:MAG TPA: pyridoxal phosphate-dependent aminotransferase [Actinophytocola sp.]|jgi:aspartate/methionine/tyrosine aminotransferase|uniref:pyridoxal phosphate-dependent aminotransferase n=1 Tax=Actinophytocola sp. TaxID=1872138 RepID=UPI002E019F6E|nr:pyridoxal phosphate-dependent aminotransferase [Actinophytocola sp.]
MALAASLPETIRLDIGDPAFDSPEHVVWAANDAASTGRTHYTPSAGIPELRSRLADKILARNGYRTTPDRVIVSQGASQGLFTALTATTEPGDEVLLPNPAWPNYLMMSQLLRIRPRTYQLTRRTDFLPTVDQLASLVSPHTRVLLINSPSNPTGTLIDAARMQKIVDFAEQHDLWIVSDECYDEIVFDDSFISPATLNTARVISAYSFSKTYAMTGWRIGYLTAPETISGAIAKCQESLLACVSEPTQWAALAALTGPQDQVRLMRETYRSRCAAALDALRDSPLLPTEPRGAFYIWLDISATGLSDHDFTLRLLKEHGVAVAPGNAFGTAGAGFVRLSLTAADADVAEGVRRIVRFAAETLT